MSTRVAELDQLHSVYDCVANSPSNLVLDKDCTGSSTITLSPTFVVRLLIIHRRVAGEETLFCIELKPNYL